MTVWRWLKRQVIGPHKELRRPRFLTDPELELRRAMARDLLGDAQVKPLRKLIEDQPDYRERRPIDWDQLPV
jgi:hypothetical protein